MWSAATHGPCRRRCGRAIGPRWVRRRGCLGGGAPWGGRWWPRGSHDERTLRVRCVLARPPCQDSGQCRPRRSSPGVALTGGSMTPPPDNEASQHHGRNDGDQAGSGGLPLILLHDDEAPVHLLIHTIYIVICNMNAQHLNIYSAIYMPWNVSIHGGPMNQILDILLGPSNLFDGSRTSSTRSLWIPSPSISSPDPGRSARPRH